jgi:Uma2 family endonuclease
MGQMPVAYQDWLQMPIVQDATEEVIDGEVIVIAPRRLPHATILVNLWRELNLQLNDSRHHVFVGNFGLVISEDPLICRNPDLVVYDVETMSEKDGYLRSAPLLAIEDPDPNYSRVTIERKLQDYQTIGTPEVWVTTPTDRTVEVFRLEDGVLQHAEILATGILRPRAFPEVAIDIESIWRD